MSGMESLPGINDYEALRVLGSGTFGVVYEVRHRHTGERFALKLLSGTGDRTLKLTDQIAETDIRNSRVLLPIEHGRAQDGREWFTMTLVEGESVQDMLDRHPQGVPLSLALDTVTQLAAILRDLHPNVAHLDLKPANILTDAQGQVWLADLGLAQTFAESSDKEMREQCVGTRSYMAPEQLLGEAAQASVTAERLYVTEAHLRDLGQRVDYRADLWAFGVILYELLTGFHPFAPGRSKDELLRNVLSATFSPSPPRDHRREIPEPLSSLSLRLLRPKLEDRPHADDILATLHAVKQRRARDNHRHQIFRRVRVIAAIACVLIVAGTVALTAAANKDPECPDDGSRFWRHPKDRLCYAWVPPGEAYLGCFEKQNCEDERPGRLVTFSSGFWITTTEITQNAYERVIPLEENPASWRGPNRPVENLTWEMAARYCAALGGRLPRESEWEYAARGPGRRYVYPWGDTIDTTKTNFGQSGALADERQSGYLVALGSLLPPTEGTYRVGSFGPNPLGLHDMAGNVSEWVSADDRDQNSASAVGTACFEPTVAKGGCYRDDASRIRIAAWSSRGCDTRMQFIGMRCLIEERF